MSTPPIAQQRYEVFGQFLLIRKLKSGGMGGSLFLAFNSKTEQLVVVKRISLKHEKKEQLTRFRDEIAIAKRLSHPGLIRILDGGDLDGHLFLEMDYVVGLSMGEVIDRCSRFQQRVPQNVAVRIARNVCLALAYAHGIEKLQLIHRDVSLSNIMLDYAGCARLIDFGIAKSTINRTKTLPGGAPGALLFAAPEQVGGRKYDHRVDVFSLGVCLWMMLAGRAPRTQFDTPGAPLPRVGRFVDVPKELDDVVAIAVAEDPVARFQSANLMAAQLERVSQDATDAEVAEFFQRIAGSPDLRLGELETQKQLAKEYLAEHPIVAVAEARTPGVPSAMAPPTMVVAPLRPPATSTQKRPRLLFAILGLLFGVSITAAIPFWMHLQTTRRASQVEQPAPASVPRVNSSVRGTASSVPPAVRATAPQELPPHAPAIATAKAATAHPSAKLTAAPSLPVPAPRSVPVPEASVAHSTTPDAVSPEIARKLEEADRMLKQSRYNSAEAVYTDVSALPGGAPYAQLGRANASLLRLRYDEAVASAAEAARSIPNKRWRAQALIVKGRAEWKSNQLEQAEADLQRAETLDPNSEAKEELTRLLAARSGAQ